MAELDTTVHLLKKRVPLTNDNNLFSCSCRGRHTGNWHRKHCVPGHLAAENAFGLADEIGTLRGEVVRLGVIA